MDKEIEIEINIPRELIKKREVEFYNGTNKAIVSIDFIESLMIDYANFRAAEQKKELLEDMREKMLIQLSKAQRYGVVYIARRDEINECFDEALEQIEKSLPKIEEYFEQDQKGHIVPLDVDFASYQSVLNKHIDQLEAENKELKEKIKRVEDSLMSDEEITKFCDNSQHWVYIAEKTKAIKIQRDLIKKALCSQPKLIYTCMHTFTQVSQEWQSCSQCGMIRPLRHNDYNNTLK